ncbi:MAG TPA: MFS transporter [Aldersonia sp.]
MATFSTTPRRGLAMTILIFASFMDLLDVTIVQVALPSIRADLDAGESTLEWIVSGYMLSFAVLLVTGGRCGDIIGRQRTFLLGIGGFTLVSAVAAAAPTGGVLVAARIVQGGFAALMVPQVLSSIQALYRPSERAPMYGITGAVTGLAAVVGPLLGGWLVSADVAGLGWRSVFLINVPVGIVVFLAALRWVPNTRSDSPLRLDVRGVLLLSATLVCLLYPLVEGRGLGWPAWLWVVAAGGVVLGMAFVASQRRDASALLPLRLFHDRGFSAGLLTQASFQGAMNAFTVVFLVYVQAVLGFDAFAAGLTLLPFALGAFLGTAVAVPLVSRVGKPVVTVGALLQAASIGWAVTLVVDRGPALTGWDLLWPFAVAGIGLGLLVVPLVDVALATVPIGDGGAAAGTYGTFQQIGAAVGVAISGTVFFGAVGTDWSVPTVAQALERSGWVAIAGYLIAAGASLLLPGGRAVRAHLDEQARLAAADFEAPSDAVVAIRD